MKTRVLTMTAIAATAVTIGLAGCDRGARDTARNAADDWIYVVERHTPTRAKAFAIPHGKAAELVRDLRAAIDKATVAFERHTKSDEHRISLDLLEEEIRYLGDKAVDEVRRRAESQNIAVVKSLDGYVLAPMHEGRVDVIGGGAIVVQELARVLGERAGIDSLTVSEHDILDGIIYSIA